MAVLTHPTLEQLHQLGLDGMARAFVELAANPTSTSLSHAEWLALLLDRESTERYERRLRARLRCARLRTTPLPRTSIIVPRAVSTASCSRR
jgi:hypothetical protein